MEELGFTAASGRSAGEIATRLIEQSILDRARLSADEIAVLRGFLGIHVPLAEAAQALRTFADRLDDGSAMEAVIATFARRVEKLAECGVALDQVTYDASFGRALDYYTGLVFEIAALGSEAPVVGGGRYDRLLTLLGAGQAIPGVGFSVWLDRLEAARDGKGEGVA
jgi:ATP phosphoribosyltransferase regulatory subunit